MKLKRFIARLSPEKKKVESLSAIIDDSAPSEMNKLLDGKNILITGAGGIIGRSIASEMAHQGANIYFTDSDESKVNALDKQLNSININSAGFVADITKNTDIEDLHNWLKMKNVIIDSLVNNVGIQFNETSIFTINRENMSRILDTNVTGPVYLTRLIVENMLTQKIQGSVIFITSIHQWVISKNMSYSASKAALGSIIKELAVELAQYGIRVNGIAPGWVAQDSQGNVLPFPRGLLHKKSIHPRYIGRSAVYLTSNYYSEFTTGATITIDGGLSLTNHLTDSDL